MFNKKELTLIIVITIILGVLINLGQEISLVFASLLGVFIAILVNLIVKKMSAFYLDTEIEIKLWEFKRWGFRAHEKFKSAFAAGIIIPVISKLIFVVLNGFIWMAALVFEVKAKKYKTAKRHGYYSFSEATESNIGGIAVAGVIANLLFGVLFYLLGFPWLAKINLWMAFFNIIPISDLDGNKIFFGNYIVWAVLAILSTIALIYTFLPY